MTEPPSREPETRRTAAAPFVLCLHLGAHRTGTTLVQNRIAALHGRLGHERFSFAQNQDLKGQPWAFWCRGRKVETDPQADFERHLAVWRKTGRVLLISAEDFIGTTAMFDGRGLYPEAGTRIGRLMRLLSAHPEVEVRLLMHIRRTPDFLASCLAQEAAKGRRARLRDPSRIDPAQFRWSDLVASIEAAAGQRLVLRDFADLPRLGGRAYTTDLLAAFGLPEPTRLQSLGPLGGAVDALPAVLARRIPGLGQWRRPNASLSTRGVALADAMRSHVDAQTWAQVVRPFLSRHFSARTGDPAVTLDPSLVAALDGTWASDRAVLADRLAARHPPIRSIARP